MTVSGDGILVCVCPCGARPSAPDQFHSITGRPPLAPATFITHSGNPLPSAIHLFYLSAVKPSRMRQTTDSLAHVPGISGQ